RPSAQGIPFGVRQAGPRAKHRAVRSLGSRAQRLRQHHAGAERYPQEPAVRLRGRRAGRRRAPRPAAGGRLRLLAALTAALPRSGGERRQTRHWSLRTLAAGRWLRRCRKPHSLAIPGPAVYPITPPATSPTGPATTAPAIAPNAASPARSCAPAAAGTRLKPPARTAAATRVCMVPTPRSIEIAV